MSRFVPHLPFGVVSEAYSYDVWGKRRAIESVDDYGLPSSIVKSVIHNRGYTGHEVLASVGLVHMNGRIYDQEIGRFLSPDPIIQDIKNTQNFNRYSYVLNDPMNYTDPSGYMFKGLRGAINSTLNAVGKVATGAGKIVHHVVESVADEAFRAIQKLGDFISEHCENCTVGAQASVGSDGSVSISGGANNTETGESLTFFSHEWENNRDPGFGSPQAPLPLGAVEVQASSHVGKFSPAPGVYFDDEGEVVSLRVNDFGGLIDSRFNGYALNADGTVSALAGGLESVCPECYLFGGGAFFRGAFTTTKGFLFGGVSLRTPINIPVQRFGAMGVAGVDYWGLRIGSGVFTNRTFAAIKPAWNPLTVRTFGVIPKGTPITFGIIGPQGFRYPGGSLQFSVNSRSVTGQSSKIVR